MTIPRSALLTVVSLALAALGPTTDEVSATADGWAFMSQFSLPADGQ